MKFSLFIAFRYLFSFKKKHIINIISIISMLGVMISSAILIIILSIFNGFEEIIHRHIDAFSVDLKVNPAVGKTFIPKKRLFEYLSQQPNVRFSKTIEEQVLLKNDLKQKPVILKGIDSTYTGMIRLDSFLYAGDVILRRGGNFFVIVGFGVAKDLGINPYSLTGVEIYAGDRRKTSMLNIKKSLRKQSIFVSGIIQGNPTFTDNYILAQMKFAREFLNYNKGEISAVEINVNNKKSIKKIQKDLEEILGNDFHVKTKIQLNQSVYKMLKTEKVSIFSILLFVLIIFTFNMLASLSMLILDKKKDINVLMAMGADISLIRRIFWLDGVLIVLLGLSLGLALGLIFCWLQHDYGLIQIKNTNYFTEYYPIKVKLMDITGVFLLTQLIGYIAAILPVKYITRKHFLWN